MKNKNMMEFTIYSHLVNERGQLADHGAKRKQKTPSENQMKPRKNIQTQNNLDANFN